MADHPQPDPAYAAEPNTREDPEATSGLDDDPFAGTADDADRIEIAALAMESNRLVWQDQVDFAKTLEEKRRTISAALAVALGIAGLLLPSRPPDLKWVIIPTFVLAAGAWLVSAHFLYTERSVYRQFAWSRLAPLLSSGAADRIITLIRKLNLDAGIGRPETFQPRSADAVLTGNRASIALAMLDEDINIATNWLGREAFLRERAIAFLDARQRLHAGNQRVRRRIEISVLLMLIAYTLLVATLILSLILAQPPTMPGDPIQTWRSSSPPGNKPADKVVESCGDEHAHPKPE